MNEYQNMPTWEQLIAEAKKLPVAELKRHASVSRDNRHRCESCFTCACDFVLRHL
jgi:hypothetical protein